MHIEFIKPDGLNERDLNNWSQFKEVGWGEFLGAHWSKGADYNTTWQTWRAAELESLPPHIVEATRQKEEQMQGILMPEELAWDWRDDPDIRELIEKERITEEEWKAKVTEDRPGLLDKYQEGMTSFKADIIIDRYDKREYQNWLIENSPGGFLRTGAGLITGLAANVPDVINFIPLLPLTKEAKAAQFLADKGFARLSAASTWMAAHPGITRGMEGAMTNLIADFYVFPKLRNEGVDTFWYDYLIDAGMAFGLTYIIHHGSQYAARKFLSGEEANPHVAKKIEEPELDDMKEQFTDMRLHDAAEEINNAGRELDGDYYEEITPQDIDNLSDEMRAKITDDAIDELIGAEDLGDVPMAVLVDEDSLEAWTRTQEAIEVQKQQPLIDLKSVDEDSAEVLELMGIDTKTGQNNLTNFARSELADDADAMKLLDTAADDVAKADKTTKLYEAAERCLR